MIGYRFLSSAEEEMVEASLFYDSAASGLRNDFLVDDLQQAIDRVREYPQTRQTNCSWYHQDVAASLPIYMMNTATIAFLILTASLCMSATGQKAKRSTPKEVTPVVYEGVRYTAPHWVIANGKRIAGGYIEAFNAQTNKKLWRLKIYETKYAPQLEKDVQDVFITSMAIEKNKLVVVNERDVGYEVDLKTRRVTKR